MHQGTGWPGFKESAADAGDLILNMLGAKNENKPMDVNMGLKGTTPLYMPKSDVISDVGIPWGPEGFYSQAEEALNATKQGSWVGKDFINYLKGKGVRDEELKWSGLGELGKQPKVAMTEAREALAKAPRVKDIVMGEVDGNEIAATEKASMDAYDAWHQAENTMNEKYSGIRMSEWPKDEMANLDKLYSTYIDKHNKLQALGDINQAKYGPDNYPNWSLPGPQENYKEILMQHSHPPMVTAKDAIDLGGLDYQFNVNENIYSGHGHTPEEAAADLNTFLSKGYSTKDLFGGSHHDEPNLLGHTRINDRHTLDGDKVGHIEEIQSDWQNSGIKALKDKEGIDIPGTHSWIDADLQKKKINIQNQMQLLAEQQKDAIRKLDAGYPGTDRTNILTMSNEDWAKRSQLQKERAALHDKWMDLSEERRVLDRQPRGSVESAPHVTSGDPQELLIKRALMEHAKDPDKKWITLTTGKQQIERSTNELRANVDHIEWEHTIKPGSDPEDSVHIKGFKEGRQVIDQVVPKVGTIKVGGKSVTLDTLIDKEWGNRFRTEPTGSVKGDDLQIGGTGKIQSYDVFNKGKIDKLLKTKGTKINIEGEESGTPMWGMSEYGRGGGYEVYRLRSGIPQTGGESRIFKTSREAENFIKENTPPAQQQVHAWPLNERTRAIIAKGFPLYSVAPLMMLPSHKPTAKPLPPPPKPKQSDAGFLD